jgi:hypothetical protein
MKIAVSFLLLLAGCATQAALDSNASDLRIEQLPDAGFAVQDRGATSVAYEMTVRNPRNEPVVLRRIEMKTVGRSPYKLRSEPATVSETIEPGAESRVSFTMWSYAHEPSKVKQMVFVSGTLHFESARGNFTQAFTDSFREP